MIICPSKMPYKVSICTIQWNKFTLYTENYGVKCPYGNLLVQFQFNILFWYKNSVSCWLFYFFVTEKVKLGGKTPMLFGLAMAVAYCHKFGECSSYLTVRVLQYIVLLHSVAYSHYTTLCRRIVKSWKTVSQLFFKREKILLDLREPRHSKYFSLWTSPCLIVVMV